MTHALSVVESVVDDSEVGADLYPRRVGVVPRGQRMADAIIGVPVEVRDVLARAAEAEGMSLRTYLTRLANSLLTPDERAARSSEARAILKAWNGYDPTDEELTEHQADLDRRIAQAKASR